MQPISNYNPDVLTCLANLSNDEVFTPPSVVNQMLDQLPSELWSDKNATFLDPVSKTGVFLREIAVRLNKGLETKIPDRQERINHIYKNQVFGLAITELTSLLSRRGVYCSKTANHKKYSVCTVFDDEQGNIRYERMDHIWQNGRCNYCGASESEYNREDALETYAYQFIHTDEPETFFNNMKFDVIIGNPPYQLGTGSQSQATPLYDKFITQAIKLNPRYLTMIVPARWYSGGMGLKDFRKSMLEDKRLSKLHDFPETKDVFPGLNIRGGICYFLWDKEYNGECEIFNHTNDGKEVISSKRPLLEADTEVFVRYNKAIDILRKVRKDSFNSFKDIVSSQKPFGFPTNYSDYKKTASDKFNIELYKFRGNGFVSKDQIEKGSEFVDKYKIFVPKASPGGDYYPHQVIGKPLIVGKDTCCSETYVMVGPFRTKAEAENVASYMKTSFFRFMVLLVKNTQDVLRGVYTLVPMQDFSEEWTDEKLYKKYKITRDEIAFINSLIRPLD